MFRQVLVERFGLGDTGGRQADARLCSQSCPRRSETAPIKENSTTTASSIQHGMAAIVLRIGFGHPLNARAIDMDDLAHYIENWTDLPVVNQTGLTGLFSVSTEGWQPMRLPPPPPIGAGNVDFTRLPTIGTVLARLGLELHRQDGAFTVYTVEHIERPSTH